MMGTLLTRMANGLSRWIGGSPTRRYFSSPSVVSQLLQTSPLRHTASTSVPTRYTLSPERSTPRCSSPSSTKTAQTFWQFSSPCRPFELVYGHIRNIDLYFTDPAGDNITFFTGAGETEYDEVEDNMAAPSDTEKTGVIFRAFDTGGSGADYGNDEALNRVYISQNDKGLILDFQSFQTETTYDKLTVRSRNETTDSWTDIFVDHTGNSVPSGNPFTTDHKRIKFWWTSDGSNAQNGWDALIYEDWDGEGTLSGDSSAGFKLTVDSDSATFGASSTDAKFFAEAQIKTT